MKKVLLIIATLVAVNFCFATAAKASNTLAVSVGFNGTVSEPTLYGNASSLNLWVGSINTRGHKLGPYFNAAVPSHELSNSEPDTNQFTRINAGLTYAAAKQVTLFGGLGWSYQKVHSDTVAIEGFTRHRLNANAGLLFHIDNNLGLSLSFDSTPQSIGFGAVYKFN